MKAIAEGCRHAGATGCTENLLAPKPVRNIGVSANVTRCTLGSLRENVTIADVSRQESSLLASARRGS